jgi:hypothetical protein
LIPF